MSWHHENSFWVKTSEANTIETCTKVDYSYSVVGLAARALLYMMCSACSKRSARNTLAYQDAAQVTCVKKFVSLSVESQPLKGVAI